MNAPIVKKILVGTSEMWLDNHIVHCNFNQSVIDLSLLEGLDEVRHQLCQGKAFVDIHDMKQVKYATKQARNFFSDPTKSKLVIAGAVLINSKVAEIIANHYLAFQKPPVPTRFFYTYQEAIHWLSTYQ